MTQRPAMPVVSSPLARFRRGEAAVAAPVVKVKKKKPIYTSPILDYFVFTEVRPNVWIEKCVPPFVYYAMKKKTPTLEKLAVVDGKMRYYERRLKDGTILDLPANPPRPFTEFGIAPGSLKNKGY